MGRGLILIGLVLVAAGLLWPLMEKSGLGRLPGDIVVDRPGMKFFFPITTMILVSLVVTALSWLFRR